MVHDRARALHCTTTSHGDYNGTRCEHVHVTFFAGIGGLFGALKSDHVAVINKDLLAMAIHLRVLRNKTNSKKFYPMFFWVRGAKAWVLDL